MKRNDKEIMAWMTDHWDIWGPVIQSIHQTVDEESTSVANFARDEGLMVLPRASYEHEFSQQVARAILQALEERKRCK